MPFPEACPSLVSSSQAEPGDGGFVGGPASCAADAATMAAAAADVMNASGITTDESVPGVSSDEDSDLGEFLLDAVQWL